MSTTKKHAGKKPKKSDASPAQKPAVKQRAQAHPDRTNRKDTKAATVIAMLSRPNGTTIDDIAKAAGWQAHSVRGFLSGTVKKRMGLTLHSVQPETGERRYMIGKA